MNCGVVVECDVGTSPAEATLCFCSVPWFSSCAADGGVGYDCHTASQHLWLFVSERSSWIVASNAALKLYDTPADMRAVPQRQPAAGTQAQRGEDSSDKQKAESQAQSSSNAARTGTDVDAVDSSMTSSEGLSGTGHSAAHSVAHAMPTAAAAGAWWWPRWRGRFLQALLRYLLLAEAGCDACAANAAWMLLRGEGAGGPKALAAAASLLYRCAGSNPLCGRQTQKQRQQTSHRHVLCLFATPRLGHRRPQHETWFAPAGRVNGALADIRRQLVAVKQTSSCCSKPDVTVCKA